MPPGLDQDAHLNEFPDKLPSEEVIIAREERAKAGGAFADVYQGLYKGQKVAVKAFRLLRDVEPESMNRKISRESCTWRLLEHENVLSLLGYIEKPELSSYILLVSPWCEYGNLAEYLKNHSNLSMMERIALFHGVAKGLDYLHSGEVVIVHGDLKPFNVLIDTNGVPKLGDFGLVRVIHEGPPSGLTTTSNHSGTLRYLAPELVSSNNDGWRAFWKPPVNTAVIVRPTTSSDVWALGCIGMTITLMIVPFASISVEGPAGDLNMLSAIKDGNLPAKRPSELGGVMKSIWKHIFEATWRRNPNKRPTAGGVCSLLHVYRKDLEI